MITEDIWYGVLEAGEKTSPVVRDASLVAGDAKRAWLYNHVKNKFVEYSLEIVAPKLRDLADGDLSVDELDMAFKAAREEFGPARQIPKWDVKTSAVTIVNTSDDEAGSAMEDADIEEFIGDDES